MVLPALCALWATLDNAGKPLNGSFSFKEDVKAYLDFLDKGLENYKAGK